MSTKSKKLPKFTLPIIIISICLLFIFGVWGYKYYQQVQFEQKINIMKLEEAKNPSDRTLTIYLQHSVTDEQVQPIVAALQAIPDVDRVEYTSKAKAMEIYAEKNKNDQDLVEMVQQQDVLPADITVYSKSKTAIENATSYANTLPSILVTEIVQNKNVLDNY